MSLQVLLQQIAIIFLEIGLGYAAAKLGLLTDRDSKFLSNLVMNITLPCTFLASAAIDAPHSTVGLILEGFLLLEVLYIICTVFCSGLSKALRFTPGQLAVLTGTGVMPNSAFIGIPLATAILGDDLGIVYAASGILAYNIFFFTYVAHLFKPNEKFRLKSLVTPTNISTIAMVVMLLLGLRLPGALQSFASAVGNCTTPLALMIVGAMLAGSSLKELAVKPFLYLVTALRCFIFPLIFMLVLWLLPLDRTMCMGVTILAACPSGSLAAVLAKQCNMEEKLASQAVAHSTLFIVISIPLMLGLAQKLYFG